VTTPRLSSVRRGFALLMVVLGIVIAVRGLVETAPFSFVMMGVLLAILGALRLGLLRTPSWGKGGEGDRGDRVRRRDTDR
jgi:hypothetical protein